MSCCLEKPKRCATPSLGDNNHLLCSPQQNVTLILRYILLQSSFEVKLYNCLLMYLNIDLVLALEIKTQFGK